MLADDGGGGRLAVQRSDPWLQPLQPAHVTVAALVEVRRGSAAQQRPDDGVAPLVHTGRVERHHQGVAIAVDNEARQAVGLAVHQSQPILPGQRR